MLVADAGSAWTRSVEKLLPGSHVAVFADAQPDLVGLAGRLAGLELRDTLVVIRSGPALGLVLLFRKPIAEATLAEQVWATGTGALNLGACRVETAETITTHSRGYTMAHPATRDKHVLPGRRRQDLVEPNERNGRWPPNVVLVHGPECQRDCESTCPVKLLDEQSGFSTSSKPGEVFRRKDHATGSMSGSLGAPRGIPEVAYGDAGGASRFYPQFKDESELRVWVERLISR